MIPVWFSLTFRYQDNRLFNLSLILASLMWNFFFWQTNGMQNFDYQEQNGGYYRLEFSAPHHHMNWPADTGDSNDHKRLQNRSKLMLLTVFLKCDPLRIITIQRIQVNASADRIEIQWTSGFQCIRNLPQPNHFSVWPQFAFAVNPRQTPVRQLNNWSISFINEVMSFGLENYFLSLSLLTQRVKWIGLANSPNSVHWTVFNLLSDNQNRADSTSVVCVAPASTCSQLVVINIHHPVDSTVTGSTLSCRWHWPNCVRRPHTRTPQSFGAIHKQNL